MGEKELNDTVIRITETLRSFMELTGMIRQIAKWIVGGLITVVIGSAGMVIWVRNVNTTTAQNTADILLAHQELVNYEVAHTKKIEDWQKGFNAWRSSKDAIDIELATNQKNVIKILDRHQEFIEKHGWPTGKN